MSSEFRVAGHRMCGQLFHWIFYGITYYPGWQAVVVLVYLAVKLHNYGVCRVIDAEDEVNDAAEQKGEPEFVVVPTGVRERRITGVCVGWEWGIAGLGHLTVVCGK